jgi:hypothetical protein
VVCSNVQHQRSNGFALSQSNFAQKIGVSPDGSFGELASYSDGLIQFVRDGRMKSLRSKIFTILILVASPGGVPMPALRNQGGSPRIARFVGQIMDSKCATTGSHESNRKKLDAKDARDCTLKCAKDGSFVLYDPSTKTVSQLNDQEKPVPFAGERVKISGRYDDWSQTIEIESIELAP